MHAHAHARPYIHTHTHTHKCTHTPSQTHTHTRPTHAHTKHRETVARTGLARAREEDVSVRARACAMAHFFARKTGVATGTAAAGMVASTGHCIPPRTALRCRSASGGVKAAADASAATTPRLAAADRCFCHEKLLIAPVFCSEVPDASPTRKLVGLPRRPRSRTIFDSRLLGKLHLAFSFGTKFVVIYYFQYAVNCIWYTKTAL